MSLTRKQMMEIVRFDRKRRTGLDFDGRRYGSITGDKAPHITETWSLCHASEVFKGREKPVRKTLCYNYIVAGRQRGKSRPDVTVVHVAVRLNGAYQPVVKDVGRWNIKTGHLELRDIDFHGLGGWIVEWEKEDWAGKRPKRRAGDFAGTVCDARWWDGGKWKFNQGLTFPWHETVNPEALKGTKYEYCQYADGLPCKAGLVDWLMMYRQEPKIELLAKMGLYNLICPSGIKALKDKKIRDWIIAHREEVAKVANGVKDITYAARHNVTLKYAEKRQRLISDIRWRMRYWNDRVKVKLDYDRLMKTLPKWHVRTEEYLRYLEYAIKCGLDLRNEGTAYPPTKGGREAFMDRLEDMEARARKKARAEIRAKRAAERAEEKWIRDTMKTRIKELEAFQKSLKRTDILKGCGYTLVLAKTQKELLAEGRKMGNCVGCGTYGRAIVKGDSLIVMLKNHSASFCDIEIDRKTWKVKQCYLKRNELAPKEVQELAKRLAAWFKEEHKRHMKRGTFKELRRKAA